MTNTPPPIVDTISKLSSDLADTRAELQDLVTAVDDYQDRVENLSAAEQELFYESVADLRDRVASASEPADLLSMREELNEAIRSPFQQIARDSLVALLEQLQPGLSESERAQTFDALEAKIPAELETVTEAYRQLTSQISDFDPVLVELLAAEIEAEPSVLQRPQNELVPLADRLEIRHEALAEMEAIFVGSDWAPVPELTNHEAYYRDNPSDIDHVAVESYLSMISESANILERHGIDLLAVLQETVHETAATEDVTDLIDALEDVSQTVSTAADSVTNISEFMAGLESADCTPEAFETDIEELQASHRALQEHDYAMVDYLVQRLNDLSEDIDTFVTRLHRRLQAQSELIEELDLSNSERTLPELHFQLHPASTAVRSNPDAALADCATLRTWLNSKLDTDQDEVEQTQLVELWQPLAEGEAIQLTDENQDAVLALANRLPLQVSLNN